LITIEAAFPIGVANGTVADLPGVSLFRYLPGTPVPLSPTPNMNSYIGRGTVPFEVGDDAFFNSFSSSPYDSEAVPVNIRPFSGAQGFRFGRPDGAAIACWS
jgi:hypothetical protein